MGFGAFAMKLRQSLFTNRWPLAPTVGPAVQQRYGLPSTCLPHQPVASVPFQRGVAAVTVII